MAGGWVEEQWDSDQKLNEQWSSVLIIIKETATPVVTSHYTIESHWSFVRWSFSQCPFVSELVTPWWWPCITEFRTCCNAVMSHSPHPTQPNPWKWGLKWSSKSSWLTAQLKASIQVKGKNQFYFIRHVPCPRTVAPCPQAQQILALASKQANACARPKPPSLTSVWKAHHHLLHRTLFTNPLYYRWPVQCSTLKRGSVDGIIDV